MTNVLVVLRKGHRPEDLDLGLTSHLHADSVQDQYFQHRCSLSGNSSQIIAHSSQVIGVQWCIVKELLMTEEAREQETRFGDQIWDWRNTVVDKMLGLVPRRTAE